MSKYKVTIKCTDMSKNSVHIAVQAYYNACEVYQNRDSEFFTSISEDIKNEFDAHYDKPWHVIVGDNFGSFVTHENKGFVLLEVESYSMLIFKSA